MSMEMAVVAFEGTNTAEQTLSNMRASQDDAWLHEVSVLEHHRGGRFSMKATTPDYGEEGHVGAGASIGGLTGLAVGAIAGPLGLLFWGTMGRPRAERSGTPAEPGPSTHSSSRSRPRCHETARRSSSWRSRRRPRS